jgi:hypothetical protein
LLTNFIGFVKSVSENPSCHDGLSGTVFLKWPKVIGLKQVFATPSSGEQIQTRSNARLGK